MTPRPGTVDDVAEIVRVTNLAYRVEDFFVRGDRTRDAEVRDRMARGGAAFLVIDVQDDERRQVSATETFSSAHHTDRGGRRTLAGSVSVQVNGDGLVILRKMRNLTVPVDQIAAEPVHEDDRPRRRTSDNMMDQGHWTIPLSVFPLTPDRLSGAVNPPVHPLCECWEIDTATIF